jgi:hypothetical protein
MEKFLPLTVDLYKECSLQHALGICYLSAIDHDKQNIFDRIYLILFFNVTTTKNKGVLQ